jgi:hypothetical protein
MFWNKSKNSQLPIIRQSPNLNSQTITITPSNLPSGGLTGSIGGNITITGGLSGGTNSGSYIWTTLTATTSTWYDPEEELKRRKKELTDEFEQNPELFSEIIVELRKRKIKKLQSNL